MYEISLVPNVKAELIKKQKTRNLVLLICVVVGIVCGVIIFAMVSSSVTQSALIASKNGEIECLSQGGANCRNTGTPVYKFENLSNILTMKDQMSAIRTIGSQRIKMSRVFPVLEVLLPSGQDGSYEINTASIDFGEMSLYMEVQSHDGFAYTLQEAFRKSVVKVYYDYGKYMRFDKEQGSYVEIPSFCIEEEVDDDGYIYGTYHKGDPGCEAPMFYREGDENEESEERDKIEGDNDEEESEASLLEEPSLVENEVVKKESEYVKIRRTYDNLEDKESYKEGNDKKSGEGDEKVKGYYFDSKCLQYDSFGEFDEDGTLNTCKLLVAAEGGDEVVISDSSYGENEEGRKTLQFKATVVINPVVFLTENSHMIVIGPSRRNVTDSYEQVSPIFKEREKIVNEEDDK